MEGKKQICVELILFEAIPFYFQLPVVDVIKVTTAVLHYAVLRYAVRLTLLAVAWSLRS